MSGETSFVWLTLQRAAVKIALFLTKDLWNDCVESEMPVLHDYTAQQEAVETFNINSNQAMSKPISSFLSKYAPIN